MNWTARQGRVRIVVFYLLFSLMAFVVVFPFLWMLSGSLKSPSEVLRLPVAWLPTRFLLVQNLVSVSAKVPFGLAFLNSTVVAVSVTVSTLVFSSLAGYSFSKFHYRGRNLAFLFVLSTMMIPFQAKVIPLYVMMRDLGWLDSYQGLIVPNALSVFGVFLMRQSILNIPDELLQAARMDGASEPRIYLTVVLPLSTAAISTLTVLTFLENWDFLFWPLIIISRTKYKTLPLVLAMLQLEHGMRFNELMAASLLSMLPVVILFLIFQRYIVQGLARTGIKG